LKVFLSQIQHYTNRHHLQELYTVRVRDLHGSQGRVIREAGIAPTYGNRFFVTPHSRITNSGAHAATQVLDVDSSYAVVVPEEDEW
jgi:hypothetical protein